MCCEIGRKRISGVSLYVSVFSPPLFVSMTTVKSYQFLQLTSAPSFETPLMNSFYQADPAPQIQLPASPIKVSSQSKGRIIPATAVGRGIRRSMSTSNVKGQAASESASAGLSSADKRRNKLGYHRTSVACGELSA